MLIQIPYSLDELLVTLQFMRRRVKAGKSWLRVFLFGDTDEGAAGPLDDEFDARPGAVVQEMWTGGVNLPWNLAAAAALGLRSEEHTSELQSLMRISYAVFCWKNK